MLQPVKNRVDTESVCTVWITIDIIISVLKINPSEQLLHVRPCVSLLDCKNLYTDIHRSWKANLPFSIATQVRMEIEYFKHAVENNAFDAKGCQMVRSLVDFGGAYQLLEIRNTWFYRFQRMCSLWRDWLVLRGQVIFPKIVNSFLFAYYKQRQDIFESREQHNLQ